jgi:small ligand-binding sensory domain FIST
MTAEEQEDEDLDEEEEDPDVVMDEKAKMAQAYQKARIPKPVLAEANFVMKTLSDDDQAFMRKALLVGLEQGGSIARTPSELARLAEGKGHLFTVHQVASAAMRDGSVTLSLGSVEIKPGSKMRFFVRENKFAKREVDALWVGYKKRVFSNTIQGKKSFQPTGCFLFPTLDRGNKFFLGKSGYETAATMQYEPSLPCISGFFSNGVIGSMDREPGAGEKEPVRVHGSSSGYFLFGSSKFSQSFSFLCI